MGQQIRATSLCGLGQTAPNPVLTTIRYFRHEYEAHIKDKKCPARVCTPLIEFKVNKEKCKMCGLCFKNCPAGAVVWEKKQVAYIDPEKCTECEDEGAPKCVEVCPVECIFELTN